MLGGGTTYFSYYQSEEKQPTSSRERRKGSLTEGGSLQSGTSEESLGVYKKELQCQTKGKNKLSMQLGGGKHTHLQ